MYYQIKIWKVGQRFIFFYLTQKNVGVSNHKRKPIRKYNMLETTLLLLFFDSHVLIVCIMDKYIVCSFDC